MTTISKKIPNVTAALFFSTAALASTLKGGGLATALMNGLVAGAISWVLAALLSYVIFSEKIPEAKAPAGLEDLEEKYRTKSGRG
ncbi:MAG: hypothetical protein HY098_09055 [Nitrospinae bacterium]|nr:hypothetical protein [Nitrospinota bacterium]